LKILLRKRNSKRNLPPPKVFFFQPKLLISICSLLSWGKKQETQLQEGGLRFWGNAPPFAGFTECTYYTAPPGSLAGRGLLVIMWIPIQHMKSISKLFESGRNSNKMAVIERLPYFPDGKPRPFNLGFSLNLWLSF
jgi:hypothetical protein